MSVGRSARSVVRFVLAFACAQASNADELVYRARPGDTLIGLGERMLENPRDWPKVQAHNRIAEPRRIPIGREIRLPLAWLRQLPATATVVAVRGTAMHAGRALEAGTVLAEGSEVVTGADGFVTLELADGSVLMLQSESRLALQRLRRYAETDAYDSRVLLPAGRVESRARRQGRVGRFEIHNPVAISAVRGTDFRVSFESSAVLGRTETLEGAVGVQGSRPDAVPAPGRARPREPEVLINAGFGTLVDATRVPRPPAPLLPPPDLSRQPALHERVLLRLRFEPVQGAERHRGQVALDEAFRVVVAETVFTGPEARFADLPDAAYFLRLRSIDAHGIEGVDATHRLVLKARPEPPFPSFPPDNGKQSGERAEFEWTVAGAEVAYRFQLARDAAFNELVENRSELAAPRTTIDNVSPGDYFWRVATTARDGDRGPFGDAQRYTQKPIPPLPEPPSLDANTVSLAWSGEPGQRFRLQVAGDREFRAITVDQTLAEPRIALPKPPAGTYYVRVQAIDPDGYVGPFTASQSFTVPPPWWIFVPLLLVPFLL